MVVRGERVTDVVHQRAHHVLVVASVPQRPRRGLQAVRQPVDREAVSNRQLSDAQVQQQAGNRLIDAVDLSGVSEGDVAALFRSTAEGETGHVHGHLEFLEAVGDPATGLPIGGSRLNLKAAVAGETHEYTDMYPGMAKQAREEGFDEIADWFETLAKAERSHANRYQKALDALVD